MKQYKKYTALLLSVVLLLGFFPVQTQAAVKMNQKKATVYVGSSVTLKLKGTSKKAAWKSSKTSVAVVNQKGKVTGKRAGTATITAKIGKKTYQSKITVKNPYLNKTKLCLQKGKKATLKLTGTTVKKWTSSNQKVVTVSSKGKVTAKGVGTAVIRCKGKNGKTYQCKVTVKKNCSEEKEDHTCVWDNGEVTKEPTCVKPGVYTSVCITCGRKKEEPIPATGQHIIDPDSGKVKVQPTCAKPGTYTYTCMTCGGELPEVIPATRQHKWDNGKVTKEPTCVKSGIKTYTCTECGAVDNCIIAPTSNHTWKSGEIIVDSRCESFGLRKYYCTVCGVDKTVPDVPKKGHIYENKVVAAPTCTKPGYTQYQCSRCGEPVYEETAPPLGHDFHTTVEAPCKEHPGFTLTACSRCDEYELTNIVDFIPDPAQVYQDMIALRDEYPEGRKWTNDDYYKWKGGIFSGGYGCAGFAFLRLRAMGAL